MFLVSFMQKQLDCICVGHTTRSLENVLLKEWNFYFVWFSGQKKSSEIRFPSIQKQKEKPIKEKQNKTLKIFTFNSGILWLFIYIYIMSAKLITLFFKNLLSTKTIAPWLTLGVVSALCTTRSLQESITTTTTLSGISLFERILL